MSGDNQRIHVFCPQQSPRLRYVFDYVFKERLAIDYELFLQEESFSQQAGCRISYSKVPLGDELYFASSDLLFQKGLSAFEPETTQYRDLIALFPTNERSKLPFDPFAAIFYFLSRYEEYLPTEFDKHDRFQAENSFAYKKGFLSIPVVDYYIEWLLEILTELFPQLKMSRCAFDIYPTYDIDHAWAFKNKGLIRSSGGALLGLSKFKFKDVGLRLLAHFGRAADPYDTFDFIEKEHERRDLPAHFFFLLAPFGDHDKGIDPSNRHFRALIKDLADHAQIGIHPSYASAGKSDQQKKELAKLREIIKREPAGARFHFLKNRLPGAYRILNDIGIQDDYSMGYASQAGFRAGTSRPFRFYDLEYEASTNLRLHPFCLMDATFQYYQDPGDEEILRLTEEMLVHLRTTGGRFSTLWHNNSLSEHEDWRRWRLLYLKLLDAAQ